MDFSNDKNKIIDYENIIVITEGKLCKDDFLQRIKRIADKGPRAIVLREKDLLLDEYISLSKQVIDICEGSAVKCVLHNFPEAAILLNWRYLQLPLTVMRSCDLEVLRRTVEVLGTSVHSEGEALEAQSLGVDYIIAGHIFETDCKKGVPGRGLDFLDRICSLVDLPVYAIGGISPGSIQAEQVIERGAAGYAARSWFMDGNGF